ncbi:MAG: hypothetical protein KatS3mg108_0211 [Isosphaeraceae bacterium]|jgi:hypothetical protein|nr:MAG: hypothetical protein KatS3mg108_0211 [Isosphaeraceae bacterium]
MIAVVRARPGAWVVGTVLAALGVGAVAGTWSARRGAEYRDRAESFARGEAELLDRIAEALAEARGVEAKGGPEAACRAAALRAEAERLARVGAWHVRLERKYTWAAEHPWAPLPPDPAPPE